MHSGLMVAFFTPLPCVKQQAVKGQAFYLAHNHLSNHLKT